MTLISWVSFIFIISAISITAIICRIAHKMKTIEPCKRKEQYEDVISVSKWAVLFLIISLIFMIFFNISYGEKTNLKVQYMSYKEMERVIFLSDKNKHDW